jgi:hypothetical protein
MTKDRFWQIHELGNRAMAIIGKKIMEDKPLTENEKQFHAIVCKIMLIVSDDFQETSNKGS